ncbi:glucosylceramidase [Vibrio sp. SCSIO 43135]|uniref:GH116 family glycosyl hydrolase n=1 Tax=Vibrio sp. SCSIO 43135 TaxID=2819096 RepID=UPI0020762B70|nr:GH116 family glycosyl hydrolase [Vibrio sp. SCSIO 43135]USD43660.1 glucosylceramidase [Vibrio sp. SCSIO 43135]
MKNKIPYTSYSGLASELCRKGDAVEFIQPWYTPISTTPENTGMAVGGIGNTFTLTAKGDTPNFSFIPGIFIDCQDQDIHFNDYYLSVMDVPSLNNLEIYSLSHLTSFINYYPAKFGQGGINLSSDELALLDIKSALESGQFYLDNKDSFERWNIEFNDKTKRHIVQNPRAIETQILVALDFFNGLLVNTSVRSQSLTADSRAAVESISSDDVTYQALYPMAHYRYSEFSGVTVERKVVSPVVKDDKRLCSLPAHWNHFELTNNSSQVKVVTLVQPFNNLLGSTYRKGRDGIQDSACTLTQNPIAQSHNPLQITGEESSFSGVTLASDSPYASDIEGEVVYGVQANNSQLESGKVTVSVKSSLYSSKVDQQVVAALSTGRTNNHFDHGIYSGREGLSSLVTVQVELQPNESVELRFAQVMDHSKILLNGWQSDKAYTQFFEQPSRAQQILAFLLPQLDAIEAQIVEQQNAFLLQTQQQIQDSERAQRFATMAMNTLSFLAESTVWDKQDKFLVKECVDYPFFNSLDVYFYGSFSLLYLLPELDGCVMQAFADAILASDATKRRYWEYEDKPYAELVDSKYEGVRAVRGAVIHDLGSPYDIQPDAYSWHNVKEWKDLAPKYILMVYRHYQHSGNLSLVAACWPAIQESIEFLSSLIEEGDTLPHTRGTDDTFDNLSSHGISIYCASLWAAGLKAAAELAVLLEQPELALEYRQRSDAALTTLESGLWDERQGYYHFFVTPVQTKHLTGKGLEALKSIGIELCGDAIQDKNTLNAYLDECDLDSQQSKLEQRLFKKQQMLELAPQVFTDEYQALLLDSDNSFGDALLADSYLQLVGLEGLFDHQRISRALDYVYKHNFQINSPKLGVANMTLANGAPHNAFQAQDVWIGVQFSVATALRLAGKKQQAEELMDTVYTALYHYAKIPFAAPEGFNCSVAVTADEMAKVLNCDEQQSRELIDWLTRSDCLLSDGRVNPDLSQSLDQFTLLIGDKLAKDRHSTLHKWLLSTGLKYTAGRYFRPGMIFAYLYGNRSI